VDAALRNLTDKNRKERRSEGSRSNPSAPIAEPLPFDTPAAGCPGPEAEGSDDRKRWIAFLEHQNALIEMVSRGASLETLLMRLADIVETMIPGARCAIMLWNAGDGRLAPVAVSSRAATVQDALNARSLPAGLDPLVTCALRRAPVAVADRTSVERWSAFQDCVDALGIAACAAQPVLDQDGATLAVIALYFEAPDAAEAADPRIVDALCPLARIAIDGSHRSRALRSANERFESIARSIPGVVYQRLVNLKTGDIRYTYISEGARELFGVSPQEILADPRALFACHAADYSANFRENLFAASREMRMWDVEAPIIARNGTRKWSHAIARPERLPDGSVLWSGVILDATRIKEANIALAAANAAKSQFLANMSHELRTPLNAVIGFSDLMCREALGPLGGAEYRQYAGDIHTSGSRLLKLINDILDIARIDAKTLALDEEIIDVKELVDATLRTMRAPALESGIALSAELPATVPYLVGDERKLGRALSCLLSNAVKFTPAGGRVGVRAAFAPETGLQLLIADTGIGIAEKDLPRVFDAFFQADAGLNRTFEGCGLGLTLSKALVELHGGTIELTSHPGDGTVATIRLPSERIKLAIY
jgi:signal transduction histidine kinase